jgi:4-diphosphocytidyl-2-C-methyl-D-erythritol kinase
MNFPQRQGRIAAWSTEARGWIPSPTAMIVFPNAKINLGLQVLRKRADGYHDIETVMVPIPLCDALEAIVDPGLAANEVVLTRSGLPVPGNEADDLCLRAVRAIQQERTLPGLRLHLHKVIPMGAGLGGGSSDGARTLLLLNDLLELGLAPATLHGMAAALGSDVPFFLQQGAQLAEGRGERLRHVEVDLAGLWLVLINPGVHVPTAVVYAHTVTTGRAAGLAEILASEPLERWQDLVVNGMESHVLSTHAAVADAKAQLLHAGAAYCSMSGSGSTVFGLFRSKPPQVPTPEGWHKWCYQL